MNKQLIEAALRAARKMLAGERLGFASSNALPDGTFAPHDAAMMREYDKVLGMLRDATEAAQREQVSVARRPLTADVVEQRLLTWRQRLVNRSGDQLALDDFMDRQSIDDLVDFVCDEDTPPGVLDALHERVQDDHDAARVMRAVIDKGHNYVLIVEPRDGGSRMQMDSGMRRIEIARMLERFAREAREDAWLGVKE